MNLLKKKISSIKIILIIAGIAFIFLSSIIVVSVFIILDFFGVDISMPNVNDNGKYASDYKTTLNRNLRNGYVPLSRVLYFYEKENTLSLEEIYKLNQDVENRKLKDLELVCDNEKLKDTSSCSEENINSNKTALNINGQLFNFPLDINYTITSFFNEERTVYGEVNRHSGWDFSVPAQTPVYSVCSGIVTSVNFTQNENIPYNLSKNKTGNMITISCNDYDDVYTVTYAHLYPNSAKVKVGDKVGHWTEVASVGTTGYSTGNHLHYQVKNKDGYLVDGMLYVNMTLHK